jgi:hypothetical protein
MAADDEEVELVAVIAVPAAERDEHEREGAGDDGQTAPRHRRTIADVHHAPSVP